MAYLALQVNHGTQAARRAAAAEAVSAVREANAHLADDPAAAAIFWKGVDGLENLSTEEQKAQFGIMTFNLFKTLEHLHSSVAVTMDIYSHVLPGMQEEAALAVENLLERT